jgi:hypothetical protein
MVALCESTTTRGWMRFVSLSGDPDFRRVWRAKLLQEVDFGLECSGILEMGFRDFCIIMVLFGKKILFNFLNLNLDHLISNIIKVSYFRMKKLFNFRVGSCHFNFRG